MFIIFNNREIDLATKLQMTIIEVKGFNSTWWIDINKILYIACSPDNVYIIYMENLQEPIYIGNEGVARDLIQVFKNKGKTSRFN